MQLAKAPTARPMLARPAARALRPVVRCSAAKQDEQQGFKPAAAVAMAAAVSASVLLQSTFAVEPALAARSGGRAGASSFSARRAQSYAPRAAPQVNSYSTTIVAAPPVYSPFGFGFGGFGMPIVMPFPFFGGMLQFMFLMLVVGFVFNVIKGALGSGASKSKSQDWDDL